MERLSDLAKVRPRYFLSPKADHHPPRHSDHNSRCPLMLPCPGHGQVLWALFQQMPRAGHVRPLPAASLVPAISALQHCVSLLHCDEDQMSQNNVHNGTIPGTQCAVNKCHPVLCCYDLDRRQQNLTPGPCAAQKCSVGFSKNQCTGSHLVGRRPQANLGQRRTEQSARVSPPQPFSTGCACSQWEPWYPQKGPSRADGTVLPHDSCMSVGTDRSPHSAAK